MFRTLVDLAVITDGEDVTVAQHSPFPEAAVGAHY